MLKQIMIPVAAFAVTVTGASAFNGGMLEKIDLGLSSAQVEVLEEVHELREAGADKMEMRELLEEAGFNRESLQEVRTAVRDYRHGVRDDIKATVSAEDYDAFLVAAAGTPLIELIDSEDDFDLFVEAHERKGVGDKEGARAIMAELGIERPDHKGRGQGEDGEHAQRGGARD